MFVATPGMPFSERGGVWRGLIDLAAGRYPAFLFGYHVGSLLPVFHFHEATVATLDPAFAYLAENGYRAVTADEAGALVRHGRHPGPRTVMLAFDDALASLWIVAGPLLRKYGLRAVTYAVPGRLREATAVRPTLDDGAIEDRDLDASEEPFVTWPELRALSDEGLVDVQSHTFSHSLIFAGERILDFVGPGYARAPLFHRPGVGPARAAAHLPPAALGHPLFARRSRMADGRRFTPDAESCARLVTYVASEGGAAFFERASWRADLAARAAGMGGRWESDDERRNEMADELALSRDTLSARIGRPVRHACLPWGVSGALTRQALERVGYETAFANRWHGRFAVAAGDDRFFLKRLSHRHLFALPGKGRRAWLGARSSSE